MLKSPRNHQAPGGNECFSEEYLGEGSSGLFPTCWPFPLVQLISFSHPRRDYYCKLVLRQGGGEVFLQGECCSFTTSASSEWVVSKSLFLFPLGCPPLPYQSCCWAVSDMVLSKGSCLALMLPGLGTPKLRRQQNP